MIKLYLAIAAVVGFLLQDAYIAYHFDQSGQAKTMALWNKSTTLNVDHKINIKVKQDEIKNSPVDVAVTSRRLHNGSF